MAARGALAGLVGMAAALVAAVAPALAGDLIFTRREASPLAENNVGRPYWVLLAQCSGIYEGAYAYEFGRGRNHAAADVNQRADELLDDAVKQLQSDRNVDRETALSMTRQEVALGRSDAEAMVDHSGTGDDSAWNWTRSACLDIWLAYRRRIHR